MKKSKACSKEFKGREITNQHLYRLILYASLERYVRWCTLTPDFRSYRKTILNFIFLSSESTPGRICFLIIEVNLKYTPILNSKAVAPILTQWFLYP